MSKNIPKISDSILKIAEQAEKFNKNIAGEHLKVLSKLQTTNHFAANNTILKLATELTASQKIGKTLSNYKVQNSKTAELLTQIHKSVEAINLASNVNKIDFSAYSNANAGNILLNISKSLKELNFNTSNIIGNYNLRVSSLAINSELMDAISFTEENVSSNELQEIEKIIDDTNTIIDDAIQKTDNGIEILMTYLHTLSESKFASKAKEYTMQIIIAIVANILYTIIAEKIHLVEDKQSIVVNQYNTVVNVNSNELTVPPSTVIYSVGKTYTSLVQKSLEKFKRKTINGLVKIPIGSKILVKAVYPKWIEISVLIDGQEKIGFTQKDGLAEI